MARLGKRERAAKRALILGNVEALRSGAHFERSGKMGASCERLQSAMTVARAPGFAGGSVHGRKDSRSGKIVRPHCKTWGTK